MKEQRRWLAQCVLKSPLGSTQRENFKEFLIHNSEQLKELKEMAKIAPSENEIK